MDDNCPETSALKAEQMDVVMGNVGGRDVFFYNSMRKLRLCYSRLPYTYDEALFSI